jgi:uncharacterized damage-inducible protein DinB
MRNAHSQMVCLKQWADRGLYDVVAQNIDKLDAGDAAIMLRILDHMHVVDQIFQHHLQRLKHGFTAPRSEEIPELRTLMSSMRKVDAWYASYVGNLSEKDLEEPIDFVFTSGRAARMTRSEIVLHVCLHGTYHRGNAGLILLKNGIQPSADSVTDFLETGAREATE